MTQCPKAQDPKNVFVCRDPRASFGSYLQLTCCSASGDTAFLQLQVVGLAVASFPLLEKSCEVLWQTGLKLPVARYLAIQTARWQWRAPQEEDLSRILVVQQQLHRPFFLPLLKEFSALNAGTRKLQVVGFEEVPAWKSGRKDRYKRLAEYRAAVVFPYDVHFIKLLELYSMGVPLYLPADFFMWAFSWTVSDPAVMEPAIAQNASETWPHPPPFCATKGLRHIDPARCHYWASYSDIARLPHMAYFASFPDLLLQLHSASNGELQLRSKAMRAFQAETTSQVLAFWQHAVLRLLSRRTQAKESRRNRGRSVLG